jgi:putative membrane protein
MSRSRDLSLSLVLLLILWSGCTKGGEGPGTQTSLDERAQVRPGTATPSPTWETSPAPPAFSEGPRRPTTKPTEAAAEEPLSDDQIVVVATTLSEGEIEQAKLAQLKAQHARVKKFAADVIAQHAKAKAETETLAKRHDLTMANSPQNTKLKEQVSEQLAKLAEVGGEEFDRTYTDAQIRQYQQALELLSTQLIPDATPDVKAQLTEQRRMLTKQLKEAQDIKSRLEATPSE